jgi:hypothetical protein
LRNVADQWEIDEGWENIKTAITEAATETIKLQEKSPENEWWDEELE